MVWLNIAKSISQGDMRRLYADIKGYASPSIITGEAYRPDIIIVNDKVLYMLKVNCGI